MLWRKLQPGHKYYDPDFPAWMTWAGDYRVRQYAKGCLARPIDAAGVAGGALAYSLEGLSPGEAMRRCSEHRVKNVVA